MICHMQRIKLYYTCTYRMSTRFHKVKILHFCWNIFIIKFSKVLIFMDLLWTYMGVITTPFSALVVWWYWYSRISEQVMAMENNTWSFSSVFSGWTKVTKELHSRACFARRRRVFLRGHTRSLTKFCRDYFSWFGWCPWKPPNLITLGNLYPYGSLVLYCRVHSLATELPALC